MHIKLFDKLSILDKFILTQVLEIFIMGIVISMILIPMLLPEAMAPKMAVFQTTFSITQLITALIGSIYAFVLWIPLKKVVSK